MKRGGLALVLTVLLAVAAAAAVFLYVTNVKHNAATGGGTVTIVVSKQDIPANTDLDPLIARGVFETKSVPTDDLVQGAITDVFQLRGQRTAYPILAGEQIAAARLQGKLQAAGGILGIPHGFQAVAVSLESQRLVGGAVQQGDHVTVYATFAAAQGQVTRTLVPDVQVLSVNTQGSMITLALTPHDAELMIFAQEGARVWLALLPPNQKGVRQPPVTSAAVQ